MWDRLQLKGRGFILVGRLSIQARPSPSLHPSVFHAPYWLKTVTFRTFGLGDTSKSGRGSGSFGCGAARLRIASRCHCAAACLDREDLALSRFRTAAPASAVLAIPTLEQRPDRRNRVRVADLACVEIHSAEHGRAINEYFTLRGYREITAYRSMDPINRYFAPVP